MSLDSNIINLNEWRYRAIVPAQPPRRKRSLVGKVAGGILIVASLGFGPYVAYSAMALDALTEPFVLGTFGVLGAYLLTGTVLFTGAYRRLLPGRSAAVGAAARLKRQGVTAEEPGVLVKFPEAGKLAEPMLLWVRCRFCSSPFQAASARDECPSCGKMAAA